MKKLLFLICLSALLFSCQKEVKFKKIEYKLDEIGVPDFVKEKDIKQYYQRKRIARIHQEALYKKIMKEYERQHIEWEITEYRKKIEKK